MDSGAVWPAPLVVFSRPHQEKRSFLEHSKTRASVPDGLHLALVTGSALPDRWVFVVSLAPDPRRVVAGTAGARGRREGREKDRTLW
nr:hypothetical protein GCM10020241_38050 [Streptoalloteichus tenebrarius]